LNTKGFIRCSGIEQTAGIANPFFQNQTDLVPLSLPVSTIPCSFLSLPVMRKNFAEIRD
jgi:hypothetical protein